MLFVLQGPWYAQKKKTTWDDKSSDVENPRYHIE